MVKDEYTSKAKNITLFYYLGYKMAQYYKSNKFHSFYVKIYGPEKTNHFVYLNSLQELKNDITNTYNLCLTDRISTDKQNIIEFKDNSDNLVRVDMLTLNRIHNNTSDNNQEISVASVLNMMGYTTIQYVDIFPIFQLQQPERYDVDKITLKSIFSNNPSSTAL